MWVCVFKKKKGRGAEVLGWWCSRGARHHQTLARAHTLTPPYQKWEEWKRFPLWWKGPSDRDDNKGLGRLCLEKLPLSSRLPPPPSPLLSSLISRSLYLPLPDATLSGRAPLSSSLRWRYNRGTGLKISVRPCRRRPGWHTLMSLGTFEIHMLSHFILFSLIFSPLFQPPPRFVSIFGRTHVLCKNVNGRCKKPISLVPFFYFSCRNIFRWAGRNNESFNLLWLKEELVGFQRGGQSEFRRNQRRRIYTLMTLKKLCGKTKLSALSEND